MLAHHSRLPPLRLYPPQQRCVDAFVARRKPRRRIFAWNTGVGKTAGALTVVDMLNPPRVLIVCPALVRRHWLAECSKWCPSLAKHAAVIEWGRKRMLSGAQMTQRAKAYASQIQIVSYDLVREVEKSRYDLIILDELHHIGSPLSIQSKAVATLLDANSTADVLGLSATLIPTEATQLWNPLRLLFPAAGWGEPHKDGSPSWAFRWRYCNVEKSDWGHAAFGVREDRRSELRTRLRRHADVLRREDIAADMPPLDLHLLHLATPPKMGRACIVQRVKHRCVEWAAENAQAEKLVVLVHHREVAREIRDRLLNETLQVKDHEIIYIDGSIAPSRRVELLAQAERASRCVVVGTHDSLNEGVRLMWADSVLVDQWSQSPGKMVQLMGRFQSVGSNRRPAVNLATDHMSYGAATTLLYRLRVVSDVLASGGTGDVVAEKLKSVGQLSEDELRSGWLDMFSGAVSADAAGWEDSE